MLSILIIHYNIIRVKQPNRVFEFLKSFNDRLNPDNMLSIAANKTKGVKKAVFGRMHALHHIAVLGLKHCLMSRRTVKLLVVIQQLSQMFQILTDRASIEFLHDLMMSRTLCGTLLLL